MPLGRMRSEQDSLNIISTASASLTGTQITAGLGSAHSWRPTHNGNLVLECKGASLLTGGTAGLLAVHLVDDPSGVWYLMDLAPSEGVFSANFDLVGNSTVGTTVALDQYLYIYPSQYTNEIDFQG